MQIIQFYLNQTAVYVNSIKPVEIDGNFGAATENSVKEFQEYFEEDDYFFIYNTEIRVEDGVIVELTRRFIP